MQTVQGAQDHVYDVSTTSLLFNTLIQASAVDVQNAPIRPLKLATAAQPRRNILPVRYGNNVVQTLVVQYDNPSYRILPDNSQQQFETVYQPTTGREFLVDNGRVNNWIVDNPLVFLPALPAMVSNHSTDFASTLFDHAMQSKPFTGLDMQLLPLHATAAQTNTVTQQPTHSFNSVAPEMFTLRADSITQAKPQLPALNNQDVARVADKVAHILQQKERLERERWGKY
jgi:hypothetical protein